MNPDQRGRTRILIVDDHPIVRLGIRQMLASEPDLEVCGEAETADAAKQLMTKSRPDLAIVDLSLADGTGLELIRWLRESEPRLPVLVLSMHDEALFAERVLRADARGYIMKRQAITGLVAAIRQVLAGRIYVSEGMAQVVLELSRRTSDRRSSRRCSPPSRAGSGSGLPTVKRLIDAHDGQVAGEGGQLSPQTP